MSDERKPFLRGRIEATEAYQSPQGGGAKPPSLPPRDAGSYSKFLIHQLDALGTNSERRVDGTRDPEATREIIAVHPATGHKLAQSSLGDKNSDVRVVGEDPSTNMVILDAPDAQMTALRTKIADYADPTKVSESGAARNAPLVSRIEQVRLSEFRDVADATVLELATEVPRWFEIGCRGGIYARNDALRSRREIDRQIKRIDERLTIVAEFHATSQTIFYAKLSPEQGAQLIAAVDCIYEIHLAERAIRDWLYADHDSIDVSQVRIAPPPADAPSVVLLDTGISTLHPLLAPLTLSATSVVPGIVSGVDVDGHGTEMAGIALYLDDIGNAITSRRVVGSHWVQAVKITTDESDSMHEAARATWAPMVLQAVAQAESVAGPANRVFATAVTASCEPLEPTAWSQAFEQLAWNDGNGRLIFVSAGNADSSALSLIEGFPQLNLIEPMEDPAQAWNVVTVGACTWRDLVPPDEELKHYAPVARAGEISPHTSAKPNDATRVPNKPDVVFEGGNVAFNGFIPDATLATLTGLTTGHRPNRPLASLWATSEATARAANLAAKIWASDPRLRPETVRGLIVHSSTWTEQMLAQFKSLDDRLRICGYGAPESEFALACAQERATVIVEDTMPNGVIKQRPRKKTPKRPTTSPTESYLERQAKFFRLPIDEELFLGSPALDIELRVTLSYFAEVHSFRRKAFRGLDLTWKMQGPAEDEEQFRWRINKKVREQIGSIEKQNGFGWDIGPQRRRRGTVQSDRWRGKAPLLAGHKLIAVLPQTGWWDERREFREKSLPFSLVVTICAPGIDVYTSLAVSLGNMIQIET